MNIISTPCLPEENKFIFTEGIDYSQTEKNSIWGTGDLDTLELLQKIDIRGKWLNLAAGDGRYNLDLLKKADQVIASDIDESAISKLWHNTPENYRDKLQTKIFNITDNFPFADNTFDGVFCMGTLHFFPRDILPQIISEMDRVLRSGGRLLIDFATDIQRVLPDGQLYFRELEPQYSLDDAETYLQELLKGYSIKIIRSEVPAEEIRTRGLVYDFSCKFLLLIADKK